MLLSKKTWKDKARTALLSIFEPDDRDGFALPCSELPWREWLQRFFSSIATSKPAPHHESIWSWFERLEKGKKPKAKIAILPRGGAKSSTVEMGVAYCGARLTRRFALYICETQDQADEHVGNIASLLEDMGVERAVGKYGTSQGWKRDQLRTANGFNVTGIGLKTAGRGIRLGKYRPDLIIIDDVDGKEDTKKAILKKIRTLTQGLLPAGSSDCAVIFVQNKIAKDAIAAQLADGRADFLSDREPVIEQPAVIGLEVEARYREDGTRYWKIIAGDPTWVGQSIATCEKQIAEWGLSAFLQEAQHDVDIAEGGLWDLERDIKPFRILANSIKDFDGSSPQRPRLSKVVVAVDPSGGKDGDDQGIVVAGVARISGVLRGFVLESYALHCSPEEMATTALDLYDAWQADEIVVETNFGGEMAESVFKAAGTERTRRIPPIVMVRVSRGKIIRAKPIQLLYDKGQVAHREDVAPEGVTQSYGDTHREMERQMCKWQPGMPSPGALDAVVIALSRLFELAEMVREVKKVASYAATSFMGTVGRRGSAGSRAASGSKRGRVKVRPRPPDPPMPVAAIAKPAVKAGSKPASKPATPSAAPTAKPAANSAPKKRSLFE